MMVWGDDESKDHWSLVVGERDSIKNCHWTRSGSAPSMLASGAGVNH